VNGEIKKKCCFLARSSLWERGRSLFVLLQEKETALFEDVEQGVQDFCFEALYLFHRDAKINNGKIIVCSISLSPLIIVLH
jgi:hypothetical protein